MDWVHVSASAGRTSRKLQLSWSTSVKAQRPHQLGEPLSASPTQVQARRRFPVFLWVFIQADEVQIGESAGGQSQHGNSEEEARRHDGWAAANALSGEDVAQG